MVLSFVKTQEKKYSLLSPERKLQFGTNSVVTHHVAVGGILVIMPGRLSVMCLVKIRP